MNTVARTLRLSDPEFQAVWRGLIEYQKVLELSGNYAPSLVADEQRTVEEVKEKISLAFFFPDGTDFPSDWD